MWNHSIYLNCDVLFYFVFRRMNMKIKRSSTIICASELNFLARNFLACEKDVVEERIWVSVIG